MEHFELYIIKSSISIVILYAFYWLFLRNETFYKWNRLYLLASILISLIVPLLNVSFFRISNSTIPNLIEPVIINGYYKARVGLENSNSISILSIIYISGAVFFALRFLLGLSKIHYWYFRFPKVSFNGFTAVILNGNHSTFTFFNILFLSKDDFENRIIDEIIVHEKAHRDGFHSFDCLLLEIVTIFQWFNPFVWLLKQSLVSEHEFIADNRVLKEGFNKVKYQKLLFEKSLGISTLSLTNNFNYSILKKRLKMMTINKSSSYAKMKYLIALPVLFAITSFAITVDSFGQKGKIYEDVDVMAKYNDGDIFNISKFVQENITYPKSARDNNVSARIYIQFVVDDKGNIRDVYAVRSNILDNLTKEIVVAGYKTGEHPEIDSKSVKDLETEAIRVIKLLSGFTPAIKDGKRVSTQYTFPINFILGNKKS